MTLLDQLNQENIKKNAPLAERMRARTLDEFYGQEHLLGPGRLLRRAVEADRLTSSIFYGPPGCGKTTLAHVIAAHTKSAFARMNAVTSGVGDVREVLEQAAQRRAMYGQSTYLLLDECHRWNKAQSDSILPAIVSRCRVFAFRPLTDQNVRAILLSAIADRERGLGDMNVHIDVDALSHIVRVANGDVRSALNALELAALTTPTGRDGIHITMSVAEESIQKPVVRCDDTLFYDMLSAFCKSLRGSDSDAALFWFSRLLYAGADPRMLARRIIAHASEDVGLANPIAMLQAVAAGQALELIGMPEARLPLSQAIIAICESPKSNSVVCAIDAAMADAESARGQVPPPLRDTHYKGADRLGAGGGYLYPHDYPGHWVKQQYMPDEIKDHEYYHPSNQGHEAKIHKHEK